MVQVYGEGDSTTPDKRARNEVQVMIGGGTLAVKAAFSVVTPNIEGLIRVDHRGATCALTS